MKSNKIKKGIIAAVLIIPLFIGFYMSYQFLDDMVTTYFEPPDHLTTNNPPDNFNDAQYFVEHGHGEIKSLATQFLTLLTGMLVFSVTFSEKIIGYTDAEKSVRIAITITWIFLVFAIVLDGIGLVCNAFALPWALSDMYIIETNHRDSYAFYEYAFHALYAMVMSGLFFVFSLIGIVAAGLMKLRTTTRTVKDAAALPDVPKPIIQNATPA